MRSIYHKNNPSKPVKKKNLDQKNQGGAPTKLTEDLIQKIVGAMMIGAYVETAAAHVGLNKDTFYKWLRQGAKDLKENNKTLYAALNDAVSKAFADAELRDVQNIDKAAIGRAAKRDEHGKLIEARLDPDWKASAWRLERKFPKRWGKQITLNEPLASDDPDKPIETFNDLVTKIANAKD